MKQAGFIDLGSIKGNVGNQNYEVPADTDLGKYRAVTIWCRRFGVNFATAPLTGSFSGGTGNPGSLARINFLRPEPGTSGRF